MKRMGGLVFSAMTILVTNTYRSANTTTRNNLVVSRTLFKVL